MSNENIKLIFPTEVIAGCISIYRNIWKNPQETINMIENFSNVNKDYGFIPAKLLSNEDGKTRTNYNMSLIPAAEVDNNMNAICEDYYKLVYATAIGYNKHYDLYEPTYFNEGFNVLKYQTGQEYKAHYDGGTPTARSISPILYLNDDYEGGEIEFVNFDIKIKPEAGMLVIFPASYPYAHIAHPVTKGTKYAIVTWLHDRPLDDISRQALSM
jgi:uncharacterized protein (UPF0262 family)